MNIEPRYFNNCTKVESTTENNQILNNPFNVLNIIPQQYYNPLYNMNNEYFNNNLNVKSDQHDEESLMTFNNEMIEQMNAINYNKESNFYIGIKGDPFLHEVSESYKEFKEGINNELNQPQNFDIKPEKIDMKDEIIFNGIDIDDSFIVEQFCFEELIKDESMKKLNLYPNKKEEKDENKLSVSCNKEEYEKTKKILMEFIGKKEGELKLENCNNKDFEDKRKQNSETTEIPNENHKKIKSSKISENLESNKNKQSEISNSKRKELKNNEPNKNIFDIGKKNKSFIKEDSFNKVKVLPDKSNSSTKDSLSSNNASNSLFKSQASLFSGMSNVENKNSIFNITNIFKDESKENKSYMFGSNFAISQESFFEIFNNSLIFDSRINKIENVHNNLSANNIEHIQDETDELKEEFLKSKRKRFKKLIKSEMRTLYDFEKNIYREFASYLSDNEEKYKNTPSLDDEFWKIIHIKDISKSNIEFKRKKIKSYSHELMKYIFSKDEISNIYENFLKDNVFHKKFISQNKKRTEYKNNNSYQLYKKNLHKIYCKKYKESDFELNENQIL